MSQDRDDDDTTVVPGDGSAEGSDKATSGSAAQNPVGKSGAGAEKADAAAKPARTKGGRRGAAAVPTGKAGRGTSGDAVLRRDADQPEDTRSARVNPVTYIKQVIDELRKVIWPTRGQMVTYTVVVFLFLIFMSALVSGVDFGAGKLVEVVFDKK